MKKVTSIKIYLMLTAVLLIVLGFIFICNPIDTIASWAWLMGVVMLLSGVGTLCVSLRRQADIPNAGSTTLMAVLQIILGIVYLFNQGIAAMTLIVMFAMWITVEGLQLAVMSFDYKRYGNKQWWLMLLMGIASVVLGFVAMLNPTATGATISVLIGLAIIFNGLVRLVAFSGIKKVQHRVSGVKKRISTFLAEADAEDVDAEDVTEK